MQDDENDSGVGEVIFSYTVHDAIADGSKVNIDTELAGTSDANMRREAGIVWPVILSASAWAIIKGEFNGSTSENQEANAAQVLADTEGQSIEGRLWDLLFLLRHQCIAKMVKDKDGFGTQKCDFRVRSIRSTHYITETRTIEFFVSVDYWNDDHGCFSVYLPEEY